MKGRVDRRLVEEEDGGGGGVLVGRGAVVGWMGKER
jgi:hypothetical protein